MSPACAVPGVFVPTYEELDELVVDALEEEVVEEPVLAPASVRPGPELAEDPEPREALALVPELDEATWEPGPDELLSLAEETPEPFDACPPPPSRSEENVAPLVDVADPVDGDPELPPGDVEPHASARTGDTIRAAKGDERRASDRQRANEPDLGGAPYFMKTTMASHDRNAFIESQNLR